MPSSGTPSRYAAPALRSSEPQSQRSLIGTTSVRPRCRTVTRVPHGSHGCAADMPQWRYVPPQYSGRPEYHESYTVAVTGLASTGAGTNCCKTAANAINVRFITSPPTPRKAHAMTHPSRAVARDRPPSRPHHRSRTGDSTASPPSTAHAAAEPPRCGW